MKTNWPAFVDNIREMWASSEYRSKGAFWIALRTRATRHAKTVQPVQSSQELLRQFVIQRFIARLFHEGDAPWVVAGGACGCRGGVAGDSCAGGDVADYGGDGSACC